jgi:hypothetical protein
MPLNDYLSLFADAGITGRSDQEKYSRYLDTAIAQEGIKVDEIIGVGNGELSQFYVVSGQAVTSVYESGIFKKRIEVKRDAPIASIAKLETVNLQPSAAAIKFEGRSERSTLTGWDSKGQVVLEIVWNGSESYSPEIRRQREHLFKLIGDATKKVHDAPARPSVSTATSKAAYLMDWAADVVKASGVEVTRERIETHANMIAAGIRFPLFVKLAAPDGIDDLGKLYPGGEMPPGTIIETFDDLYGHVVALVGDARPVDQEIDLLLASSWGEFVNGCRESYS